MKLSVALNAARAFVVLALFWYVLPTSASEYKEGEHYKVVSNVSSEGADSIIEFFSYSCPYCFRSQPASESLIMRLPSGFQYKRIAVTLGKPDRLSYAYTHLLLKEFDFEDAWHSYIFFLSQSPLPEEMKKYDKLWTMDNVRAFFLDNGVGADEFDAAIRKIDEGQLIRSNDKLAGFYKVKGTPTFVINGRYWVEGIPSGPSGQKQLEDLLVYLAERK